MIDVYLAVFSTVISSMCVVLNAGSMVLLLTTKNLRQVRFKCLVLYLSISDILIGLQSLASVFVRMFKSHRATVYICEFIGTLMIATTMFSMFQVLLICLERLNATFALPNAHLKRMTSDNAVIVGFILLHIYPVIFAVVEVTTETPECKLLPTFWHLISLDIPVVILTLTTLLLYFMIIQRIIRQHKQINSVTGSTPTANNSVSTGSNSGQRSAKEIENRRRVINLGLFIILSALIIVPRTVVSIYLLLTPSANTVWLNITTGIMILNPILDPFIYVFRIKAFRKRFQCSCSKHSTNSGDQPSISRQTVSLSVTINRNDDTKELS